VFTKLFRFRIKIRVKFKINNFWTISYYLFKKT